MAVQEKIIDDVGIVKIRGALIGDEETTEVRETVRCLIERGIRNIALDVSRVKWMNSNGLGTLMACYSAVDKVRGKIGLIKIPDKVHKIMSITRVHTLFDQFGSIREAVKAYRDSTG